MSNETSCCAVGRADVPNNPSIEHQPNPANPQPSSARPPSTDNMVKLNGGSFLMGSNDATFPADGERPVRKIILDPFWIDTMAVTNTQFAQFVEATGYITEAERFGWSYVFFAFLPENAPPLRSVPSAPWWRQVFGTHWRRPEGFDSTIETRPDHPVVHISWNDAVAYAQWCGKRLPTEAEWEYAARGGLKQKQFPWGDKLQPGGKHQCNIWQGKFPTLNTQEDGYFGTCPVTEFQPNRYGLYNTSGNVWEWCADWYSPIFHQQDTHINPQGPAAGTDKVTKGGSYLCHRSYCNRYRVSARTYNTPDSSTGHTGFRLVMDA